MSKLVQIGAITLRDSGKNLETVEAMLDRVVDKLTRAACFSGGAIQAFRRGDRKQSQQNLRAVREALVDLEPLISVASWELQKKQPPALALRARRSREETSVTDQKQKVLTA